MYRAQAEYPATVTVTGVTRTWAGGATDPAQPGPGESATVTRRRSRQWDKAAGPGLPRVSPATLPLTTGFSQ